MMVTPETDDAKLKIGAPGDLLARAGGRERGLPGGTGW